MQTARVVSLVMLVGLAACPRQGERPPDTGNSAPIQKPGPPGPIKVPMMNDATPREYGEALLTSMRGALAAAAAAWPGMQSQVELSSWGGSKQTVTLDLTPQVIQLDVPDDRDFGESEGPQEAPLSGSFGGDSGNFLSAAVLAHKAKVFDDGLYAVVELAAEQGVGSFPSRRTLLTRLSSALAGASGPTAVGGAVVLASAQLRGLAVKAEGELAAAAKRERQAFLNDDKRSKPIGFYTWSQELIRVFQGDRMLQTELKPEPAQALARVLGQDPQSLSAYEAMLQLAAHLTNPLVKPDLRQLARGKGGDHKVYAFLPPSAAHETELIKKLYGNRPIPDGFNLADELISRVRQGTLSLKPRAESGWYDHQTWALEPLVRPETTVEAGRLQLTENYRKELVGLFKALLALTRETHIKQLEMPTAGGAPPEVKLWPRLTVEPLPTHYLRRARSYAFVRGVLERALGQAALGQIRRQTPAGPTNLGLDEELRVMEGLFWGAYLTTCDELGLKPEGREPTGDARALLRVWAAHRVHDPDLRADLRTMVPVFYDIRRRKMKVWLVLGVTTKKLQASYVKPPLVKRVVDASGKKLEARTRWDSATYPLAYFVTAEHYVTKLLDRAEFRALCDRYKTVKQILAHLE